MDRTWRPDDVELRLADAFRELPGAPVFSRSQGEFRVISGCRLTGAQLISVIERLLCGDEHRDGRLALMTYARSLASGPPVAAFLEEYGWSRQCFDARRRKAAQSVADGINAVNALSAIVVD